ncbi:hypothetical protein CANARDRAFT_6884 [[Candida] arabinofermentans NRRL YB-2248]|uniref:Uncharacterized protein n=1 Tax=[Candida] arabinofermentans NRRL YB-2248 TaxID=983967 RepID=A0A1E4T3S9_9ASCO|nr:hypothetical protein CANARDRAFT_6884 [[Candida] arabinofermentans NRRL YB-2248]
MPRLDPTLEDYTTIISTNLGSTILEIQGELNLPQSKPENLTPEEEELFIKSRVPKLLNTTDEVVRDAVRFGRLELEPGFKKATLFISNSQRLVGSVEKVDPPLGVLRIVKDDNNGLEECQVVDVISHKVVFRLRPLPIM